MALMSQDSPDFQRKRVYCLFLRISGELPEKGLNPFALKRRLEKMAFELSFISDFYSASFSNIGMTMKRLFTGWKSISLLAILL
jgi:hypothetical protein